jgi:hypothetical protein
MMSRLSLTCSYFKIYFNIILTYNFYNFANKRRLLGRYSSRADSSYRVCFSMPKPSELPIINSMELSLLERPPVVQPLKNFPTFHETPMFVTMHTTALPLDPILSQTNPVHTTPSYLSKFHLYIIHPLLVLSSGIFPSGFPILLPYSCYMSYPPHPP